MIAATEDREGWGVVFDALTDALKLDLSANTRARMLSSRRLAAVLAGRRIVAEPTVPVAPPANVVPLRPKDKAVGDAHG
jgi:hypothetical protein